MFVSIFYYYIFITSDQIASYFAQYETSFLYLSLSQNVDSYVAIFISITFATKLNRMRMQ